MDGCLSGDGFACVWAVLSVREAFLYLSWNLLPLIPALPSGPCWINLALQTLKIFIVSLWWFVFGCLSVSSLGEFPRLWDLVGDWELGEVSFFPNMVSEMCQVLSRTLAALDQSVTKAGLVGGSHSGLWTWRKCCNMQQWVIDYWAIVVEVRVQRRQQWNQ